MSGPRSSGEAGAEAGDTPLPERPIDRLLAVMARLRGSAGCPWDREQTLASLAPYLVEECFETLEAIDEGVPEKIREELGDVLLQVVFQARICEEAGWFRFEDVATAIAEKLIRRHPHVFGDVRVADAREVLRNWEAIKRRERGAAPAASAVDGVPRHLPALQEADQVQRRAARVGFDWDDIAPVIAKLDEEIEELRAAMAGGDAVQMRDEIGDVLFTVVNLARFLQVNAEHALHATTRKFGRRFREVERRTREAGRSMAESSLDTLDAAWNAVKASERIPPRPEAP